MPISVARRVMEQPSLNMLVGGGAVGFAREQGFQLEDNDTLLSPETRRAFQVCVTSLLRTTLETRYSFPLKVGY